MKTYVKSISVKASDLKRKGSEPTLPCSKCKEKCKGATCDALQESLKKFDEYAVEWDVFHDGLEITRVVCKTAIWLALIGSLFYIAIRVCK